jgi:hypothetical protein
MIGYLIGCLLVLWVIWQAGFNHSGSSTLASPSPRR